MALILHGFGRCGLKNERLFSLLADAARKLRFHDLQVRLRLRVTAREGFLTRDCVQAVASVIGSFSYIGYEDVELYQHLVTTFTKLTSGNDPVFSSRLPSNTRFPCI